MESRPIDLITPSGRPLAALIFDMDGTLFDSERLYLHTWKLAEAQFGFTGSEAFFTQLTGTSRIDDPIAVYTQLLGDPSLAEAVYRFRMEMNQALWDPAKAPLKPGARAVLTALWNAGFPTALATSSRLSRVEELFQAAGLIPRFQAVLTADQHYAPKPEPDIFLSAAAQLGHPISACAVVEDSRNGVLAGAASGAYTILIPDLLPPDEASRSAASAVLEDMWALADHLALPVDSGERTLHLTCVIQDALGIHARPAGLLAKTIRPFACKVTVAANGRTADARRVFDVMELAVKKGQTVTFTLEGPEAQAAAQALEQFCQSILQPQTE